MGLLASSRARPPHKYCTDPETCEIPVGAGVHTKRPARQTLNPRANPLVIVIGSFAQVGLLHLVVMQQGLGTAFQADTAAIDHVGALAGLQRQAGVLLHQQ